MRAVVFMLCLVLAFVLVLKFYPSSSDVDAEGQTAQDTLGAEGPSPVRFLEQPEEPAETPRPAEAAPRVYAEDIVAQEPDDGGSWLEGIELAAPRDEGELRLAAALIHGGTAQVVAAAAGGPPERGLLAEAFSLAIEGKPREGLAVASRIPEGTIGARERGLLQAALEGRGTGILPASAAADGPLVFALEMSLLGRQAEDALARREYAVAARAFSELLLAELDAPWEADHPTMARWTEGLDRAQKHHRWNRKGDWPAVELQVQSGDSLVAIRKRYLARYPDRSMCTGLIQAANQLQENAVIHGGQTLRVPTDPASCLVDLSARWCLYLLGDEVAGSWPVGVGRPGEETVPGEYTVGDKLENPPWTPIGRDPIPFGDPRNPLGTRWMKWFRDGIPTSLGFHGTNEPETVGTACSDGCVRFLQADVERLFEILPAGGYVLVRE